MTAGLHSCYYLLSHMRNCREVGTLEQIATAVSGGPAQQSVA